MGGNHYYHNNSLISWSIYGSNWIKTGEPRTSDTYKTNTSEMSDSMSLCRKSRNWNLLSMAVLIWNMFKRLTGKTYLTVVKTMMRVDPPQPSSQEQFSFKVKWWYNINDRMEIGGARLRILQRRMTITSIPSLSFSRMAVYNDVEGWQNKQFPGRENLPCPSEIMRSTLRCPPTTMLLQAEPSIICRMCSLKEQMEKLEQARRERTNPVVIVSEEEARKNEKDKSKGKDLEIQSGKRPGFRFRFFQ